MPANAVAAMLVVFAVAAAGVIGIVIYNSLRGVRVTREAITSYLGLLFAAAAVAFVLAVISFGL